MPPLPGPTGPPTKAPDIPWAQGAPPFPQVPWSPGQGIPDPIRDWFRQTVGPLASWYTQVKSQFPQMLEGMPGGIDDWAANPIQALRQANLPQPLLQGIFDYGVNQFQGHGVGGHDQWSPNGEAYNLWSQFLGMDNPRQIGPPAVPPNPELPPPDPRTVDFPQGQLLPQGTLSMNRPGGGGIPGGTPGPVPRPGGPPPHWLGPPGRIDPGQFDWLRGLRPQQPISSPDMTRSYSA